MNSDRSAITEADVVDGLSVGYLKYFGLWRIINDNRTSGRKNAVLKLKLLATLVINMPSVVCQCVAYFLIRVDLEKATFLNVHALPCLQMCARYIVFWCRIDSQCRILSLLRKDFLSCVPPAKKQEASRIYREVSRRCNLFCAGALFTNAVIIVLWIGFPCISIEYMANHTGSMAEVTGGRYKILGGWYPLPMDRTPYFESILAYEVVVVVWDASMLAVYACLFYQPLMCLCAHLTVLGHHVSTLKVGGPQDMYGQLYAVIQDHKKLIRYCDELRNVYNPLVTMTLGMGIFVQIICVFQFLYGGTKDFMFMFKFVEFLAYQGVEVSMFCFGSSAIETASSDLQLAVYSSEWYKADSKLRQTAHMVMVRASKPLTLTALRMYPVNVQTLMSIFQLTYKASALLSRMTEKS